MSQMYYATWLVSALLPDALDPNFDGQATLGPHEHWGQRASRDLSEGGNWLTMVVDVRRALKALELQGASLDEATQCSKEIVAFLNKRRRPPKGDTSAVRAVQEASNDRQPIRQPIKLNPKNGPGSRRAKTNEQGKQTRNE